MTIEALATTDAAQLDAAAARDLTTQLQGLLSEARDLLITAYERGAWKALGYKTWRAYVAAELSSFSLPPEMVESTARELKARGWSNRAIGEPLRISEFKVRRLTEDVVVEGEIIAADGKQYTRREIPAPAPVPAIEAAPMPVLPKTDTVVLDLLAAGEYGLTGAEFGQRYGWSHAVYSATLSRLAKSGRAVRLAQRRGVEAVYVHPEHVGDRDALAQRQRLAVGRDERLALTAS